MIHKKQVCCFSGHRIIPKEKLPQIEKALEKMIIELISQGVIFFGNGGALGFDQLAAEKVLRLKEKYPHIGLVMVLPCPGSSRLNGAMSKKNDTSKYLNEPIRYAFCRRNTPTAVCLSVTGIWSTTADI